MNEKIKKFLDDLAKGSWGSACLTLEEIEAEVDPGGRKTARESLDRVSSGLIGRAAERETERRAKATAPEVKA